MLGKLVFSAALVSSVAASAFPQATTATGCTIPTNVLSILDTIPTLPTDLESVLATVTDWCTSPSLTGTLEAEFTSYASQVTSWAKANSAALLSYDSYIATACPALTAAATGIPVCSTDVPNAGLSTSAGAAGTSSTHKGAAAVPQATAMAAAAGVFAGAVGLLAL